MRLATIVVRDPPLKDPPETPFHETRSPEVPELAFPARPTAPTAWVGTGCRRQAGSVSAASGSQACDITTSATVRRETRRPNRRMVRERTRLAPATSARDHSLASFAQNQRKSLQDGLLRTTPIGSARIATVSRNGEAGPVPHGPAMQSALRGLVSHIVSSADLPRQRRTRCALCPIDGRWCLRAGWYRYFGLARRTNGRDLSRDAALALFRIAQEALGNAAKHARATMITVRLTRADALVFLAVSDDGVGFAPNRAGKPDGLGLITMRERASQLDGKFECESAPGVGTTIRVVIPFR